MLSSSRNNRSLDEFKAPFDMSRTKREFGLLDLGGMKAEQRDATRVKERRAFIVFGRC